MSGTNPQPSSFQELARHYPYPYIYRYRQDHLDLIGCPYTPKSLANLDSAGKGCKGAVRIGGKVAYPADLFAAWLDEVTIKHTHKE
jgi:hypothetical protein